MACISELVIVSDDAEDGAEVAPFVNLNGADALVLDMNVIFVAEFSSSTFADVVAFVIGLEAVSYTHLTLPTKVSV